MTRVCSEGAEVAEAMNRGQPQCEDMKRSDFTPPLTQDLTVRRVRPHAVHDRETEFSLGQILRETHVVLVLRPTSASASPSTSKASVSVPCRAHEDPTRTPTRAILSLSRRADVSPPPRGAARLHPKPTHLVRVQVHVIIPDLEEHGDEVDEGDVVAAG
jgi:hypothetical protein